MVNAAAVNSVDNSQEQHGQPPEPPAPPNDDEQSEINSMDGAGADYAHEYAREMAGLHHETSSVVARAAATYARLMLSADEVTATYRADFPNGNDTELAHLMQYMDQTGQSRDNAAAETGWRTASSGNARGGSNQGSGDPSQHGKVLADECCASTAKARNNHEPYHLTKCNEHTI